MLPWLLIANLVSECKSSLSSMVKARIEKFPCSEEINYRVTNASKIEQLLQEHFAGQDFIIDKTDGISMEFADWRFNLRKSNTEPLIRLNLEVRGKNESLQKRITELETIIDLVK
jgi:phosphomannomutase